MDKRVAVVIKDPGRQYEGLRLALGLLLERHTVEMYVLNHPIRASDAFVENMSFIEEMGGARLSDVEANVRDHGFAPITLPEAATRLEHCDVVIPF